MIIKKFLNSVIDTREFGYEYGLASGILRNWRTTPPLTAKISRISAAATTRPQRSSP